VKGWLAARSPAFRDGVEVVVIGSIFGYLDLSDHLHRAVGGRGHGGRGTTEQYSWVKCRRVATAVLCLVSAAVLDQLSTRSGTIQVTAQIMLG
jgi:hypothetical protein